MWCVLCGNDDDGDSGCCQMPPDLKDNFNFAIIAVPTHFSLIWPSKQTHLTGIIFFTFECEMAQS